MNYNWDPLKNILDRLPEDTVSRAAACINRHRRIFVYAAGRSGLMLKAFAMRLAQMGRTVYVVGETVTPALEPGDLLILASASGKTQSVCRYAQKAKEIGADLFIITATADSPLTQIAPADILISAPNKNSAASGQIMGSLFEQSLLLLCDNITENLGADPAQMRLRHANLE